MTCLLYFVDGRMSVAPSIASEPTVSTVTTRVTSLPTPAHTTPSSFITPTMETDLVSPTISTHVTNPKADDMYFPPKRTDSTLSRSKQFTASMSSVAKLTTGTSSTKYRITEFYRHETSEHSDFEVNNLTFVLFGVIGVFVCTLGYFIFTWRQTINNLRRNKDELYFVEKAHRQDSNAILQSNEMLDPVYAEMTPQPPPRPDWPPVARTDVHTPQRTESVSSETPVKESFDDSRHDYLELI